MFPLFNGFYFIIHMYISIKYNQGCKNVAEKRQAFHTVIMLRLFAS